MLGSQELLLIIIFVIFILFGGSAIPKFAKAIGEAKAAFKKGQENEDKLNSAKKDDEKKD